MRYKPMTYLFRSYCPADEPAQYAIYFCNQDGEKATLTFDSIKVAKAFAEALDGLGYTRKRR